MTAGEPSCLLVERRDSVVVATLNRPAKRNAFTVELYGALTRALRDADGDQAVGAVVLTGSPPAFCAGTDLGELELLAAGTPPPGTPDAFPGLLAALAEIEVPLVAAVNGAGVGLGLTMLAFCDFVFIAEHARLKVPFAEMGVPPEAASSYLLPIIMGWQRAARVLLAGEWLSAAEAVAAGIATGVCDDASLLHTASDAAARVAAHGQAARRIKRLMRAAVAEPIAAARIREDAAYAELFGSERH